MKPAQKFYLLTSTDNVDSADFIRYMSQYISGDM